MSAGNQPDDELRAAASCCFCCLVVFGAIAGLIYLFVLVGISQSATYSVTVTSVGGLDPAADLLSATQPTLSPVFNLTVRIYNARERFSTACLGSFATAAVTYGDAFLGKGSVPEFCAGKGKVRERGVRAWGHGVDLPRFLRDQMAGEMAAGEAAVDVEVTVPDQECIGHCLDQVFTCSQAKIGGGPAPCRVHRVHPRHKADPAAGSID